eukprot:CAMPEP_0194375872 /NCGR_PEP_ID=MMETSP0174-20130528/24421_1 /TAXON_ID=216777 /ORGANISM="Proboscia alata, Strain PI-D3" /LENGTH=193 /DNA_ID=CAMNT_0039156343 /DNA_START=169 /DNA_END=746 /DNA_ORIENTATION=+
MISPPTLDAVPNGVSNARNDQRPILKPTNSHLSRMAPKPKPKPSTAKTSKPNPTHEGLRTKFHPKRPMSRSFSGAGVAGPANGTNNGVRKLKPKPLQNQTTRLMERLLDEAQPNNNTKTKPQLTSKSQNRQSITNSSSTRSVGVSTVRLTNSKRKSATASQTSAPPKKGRYGLSNSGGVSKPANPFAGAVSEP